MAKNSGGLPAGPKVRLSGEGETSRQTAKASGGGKQSSAGARPAPPTSRVTERGGAVDVVPAGLPTKTAAEPLQCEPSSPHQLGMVGYPSPGPRPFKETGIPDGAGHTAPALGGHAKRVEHGFVTERRPMPGKVRDNGEYRTPITGAAGNGSPAGAGYEEEE
jgi:hypothetical protein